MRRARLTFLTLTTLVAAAAAAAVVLVALLLSRGSSASGTTTAPGLVIDVGRDTYGRPIPAGFVGLSLEFPAIEAYAGSNPNALDPVFTQLVRNLAPGQAPALRIGGDSTDWTSWPVPGMPRPPGVTFTLDQRWLQVVRALGQALSPRLILGVNLEANSLAVAGAEASATTGALSPGLVQALEPGNEPELYGSFAWYHTRSGQSVPGRPRSYDHAAFVRDFVRFARVLREAPLAGPATGAPEWMRQLDRFLAAAPRLGIVTLHRYPLQLCFVRASEAKYPTIPHLLSDGASRGLADSVAPYVRLTHGHGLPLRIDEMNTISCGSDPAVGESFASALWALDATFQMARVGVDGVNIHTFPGATYELFTFTHRAGHWRSVVLPEYYGLMLFAQAAPPGARLLRVVPASAGPVKTWATRARDGHVRIVLINQDGGRRRVVSVRVAGATGAASLERLQAPRLGSRGGVTLGGESFGASTDTGVLGSPRPLSVPLVGGGYTVSLPPGSAAMLVL